MSVHHASERGYCWWCGEALLPVSIAVFWHGYGGELELHPSCAQEFGNTLIFEARRAEMLARGQNLLSGVVARCGHDGPNVIELRRERGGR
jgi:hypothetical protein